MKTIKHFLAIISIGILGLSLESAQACLWDSSIDPVFLNSNPIEICINPPPASVMQNYGQQAQQASVSIRSAIQSLEDNTILNFNIHPEFCEDNEEANQRSRMRIDLMASYSAPGQAILDEGFATAQRNLLIPMIDNNNQVRSLPSLTFVTQHEILHLLGIQHDDRNAMGTNPAKRREQMPHILELTETAATANSIMNIEGTELTPLLMGESIRSQMGVSRHDIQCIRSVYQERNRIRLNEQRNHLRTYEASSTTGVQ